MTTPTVFQQDRSWSLPIDGPTIAFVNYDPISSTMLVIYKSGSPLLLGSVGLQATTQINSSPNREVAVLALINTSPHLSYPRPVF